MNYQRLKNYKYECILLLILLVGIFFRFYNTPARYGFDFDPTRDALVTLVGAEQFQFPLVGARSGLGPFTFGPWYYYQLIIANIVLPFEYAPWIYIGITSVLVILILYKIGVLLEDKLLGIVLAGVGSLSPAELGPITGLSNPNLVPLQAALAIWICIKFLKESPNSWWAFSWGLMIGIGINHHYQMLGLLLLPLVTFIYMKTSLIRRSLFCVLGLIAAFIPLLFFNVLNHWHTITGFWYYITVGRFATYIPNRWLTYIGEFWPEFWAYVLGVPILFGTIIGLGTLCIFGYLMYKKRLAKEYLILIAIFLVNVFLLRYVAAQREYYYFLYLHPFLFIFFGFFIWYLAKLNRGKYIAIIILIVGGYFVLTEDFRRLEPRQDHLAYIQSKNEIIEKYPNSKFQLYECKNKEKNRGRIQAIVFFLKNQNKISSDDKKLAFSHPDCPLNDTPYQVEKIIDVSRYSDKKLQEGGWKPITPETVYDETVRWWMDDLQE